MKKLANLLLKKNAPGRARSLKIFRQNVRNSISLASSSAKECAEVASHISMSRPRMADLTAAMVAADDAYSHLQAAVKNIQAARQISKAKTMLDVAVALSRGLRQC